MSRKPLVTAEAVFEAADRLHEQDRSPSLRAVRNELGGGSFGTISPFLKSWRRARGLESDDDTGAQTAELPPAVTSALDRVKSATEELEDALQAAAGSVHSTAMAAAADSEETERLRGEMEGLQRMALQQISALRDERDQLAGRLKEAEGEIAQLKAWRKQAVQHIRALSGRLSDG